MSFVRPEARAAVWRWREVLIGAGLSALGLWWIFGTSGLLQWIGGAVALAGVALAAAGVQRGRFRGGAGGPGVVRVDEGQVAYFGPLTGGVVALSEVTAVAYDPTGKPGHWVLSQPGQADLMIPVNAEGADALFDAFASLPGMRTERVLAAMRTPAQNMLTVWRRDMDAVRLSGPG